MARVMELLDYLRTHPAAGVAAVALVVGLGYLLNRKPRLAREADERVEQLRRNRGEYYNKLRPPK